MRMRLTLSIAWQDFPIHADENETDVVDRMAGNLELQYLGIECCRRGGDYILSVSVWENRDGSLDSDEGVHGH